MSGIPRPSGWLVRLYWYDPRRPDDRAARVLVAQSEFEHGGLLPRLWVEETLARRIHECPPGREYMVAAGGLSPLDLADEEV